MKLKTLIVLSAVLPLFLSCGGKEDVPELPPPVIVNPDLGGGDDDGGDDQTPGEWEANRGKVVTPSGDGWTTKTVREGITYYTFSGKDLITNAKQQVFVIDVDLENPAYAVRLPYTTPSVVTSEAHKKYNSIATLNAGYELGSIYVRSAGSVKSNLPNTTIGTSGVSNWKSEAAFFCDGERSISIRTAEKLIRPYISPDADKINSYIVSQRSYYSKSTEPYLISSSPMLIDDYEPVGATFVDYTISGWKNLNGEHPQKHQRARHPRTAVALTENNHFIMFAVDGRNKNSEGMSAKELTQFLVKWFNPQYALNMDGGGSTTLCVEGEGDPQTHVVNYPCDNDLYDHAGERSRTTHFIIVAK